MEAMTVDGLSEQVAARIGFAERWLDRARTQCTDGNVAGGLLTLALADAEVRYALETGGWPAGRARRRSGGLRWLVAAAAVAAVVVWVIQPRSTPVSAGPTAGPPVVRLPGVGSILAMTVPMMPSAAVPAVRSAAVRVTSVRPAPRIARGTAGPVPARAAIVPVTTSTAVKSTAAPATATSPASVHPSTSTPAVPISDVDLIEMVLAADRTLRGTSP
jgi:hypothetical protein